MLCKHTKLKNWLKWQIFKKMGRRITPAYSVSAIYFFILIMLQFFTFLPRKKQINVWKQMPIDLAASPFLCACKIMDFCNFSCSVVSGIISQAAIWLNGRFKPFAIRNKSFISCELNFRSSAQRCSPFIPNSLAHCVKDRPRFNRAILILLPIMLFSSTLLTARFTDKDTCFFTGNGDDSRSR